jgi:hypothetical protein
MRNRADRTRYPLLKTSHWSRVHSEGEVTHKQTLKIRGTII